VTAEKKRFSSVNLPENADGPYEIFVNGVPQHDQDDYVLEDRTLYFFKPIRKEEKLGFWRWLVLFIGIAGSYKQNDSVDVTFTRDGARFIDTGLKITVLIEPTEEEKKSLAGSYSPGG
jgi:hypothetical protein